MKNVIIIILLSCTCQCTKVIKEGETENESINKYFNSFPNEIELKGIPLDIESSHFMNMPFGMWKIDSLLILDDNKTRNKILHFIDIKSNK